MEGRMCCSGHLMAGRGEGSLGRVLRGPLSEGLCAQNHGCSLPGLVAALTNSPLLGKGG